MKKHKGHSAPTKRHAARSDTVRKSKERRYFHLITDEQWERMKRQRMTWAQVCRAFRQPEWCSYPDAVNPMGCWSLVGRMVTGEDYCKSSCDLYKPVSDTAKA